MVALLNVMPDTHVLILIFWIISNNRGQETTARPGNAENTAGRGAPYLVLEMAQHCTWLQNLGVALKTELARYGKLKTSFGDPI